ncbi:MAG TPA: RimK/LysX family protein [Bdellovibrionales bacterium]|nr:RimK/LysX family protein [Bdellovibrionales bacterium]
MKKTRKIIGWREWVSLPELGVETIKVKVDSGARTCALHATKIRYLESHNGETWVSFVIISQLEPRQIKRVRARLLEQRMVRSSMGHASLRPVIVTDIQVGGERWPVEITLVNRDPMGFRMLIGRQALKGRFLIHPAKSFLQSTNPHIEVTS